MEYACGNIFIRPSTLQKGEVVEEHMHEFDHTTFFVAGRFRAKRWRRALDADGKPVFAEGKEVWLLVSDREFRAGQWCLIEKGVRHLFEALEDGSSMACIYAHRDPQSREVVQDFNGWMKAYE